MTFAIAGGVVMTAAAATPAAAQPSILAVPGLQRVTAVSASNANDFKSVTATCPAGKVLIGTGYVINGATGEVVVDDLRPNGGPATAPTSVFVGAYEEDPLATNWSVTAYAVCANPLDGLVRVTATGTSGSVDFQSVSAVCPAGKQVTGGGFELTGASGAVVVDDFVPSASSVFAGAHEADPDFTGTWSITSYAICANPLDGLTRVVVSDPLATTDYQSTLAVCTAPAVLIGSGFQLYGATGEAVVDDFAAAATSVSVGAYEADPDYVPTWNVASYAICANP